MLDDLKQWVNDASRRADVRQAVAALHEELAAEVAARQPLCILSGRCCKFEEFGHRLFVTTMDLAAFVHEYRPAANMKPWNGVGCPFQAGKLCGVHGLRPLGCRIFFCDESSTEWQNALYERLHAKLKSLHDQLNVPYIYIEWRQALGLLGLDQPVIITESF